MDWKAKLLKAGEWFLARWEEPSTWSGGGVAALLVIYWLGPTLGAAVLTAFAATGAVLAIVLPEKGK